jgi:hypothetical protein
MSKNINAKGKEYFNSVSPSSVLRAKKSPDICFFERWLPLICLFNLESLKNITFAVFLPLWWGNVCVHNAIFGVLTELTRYRK